MNGYNLNTLMKRLEAATSRLEDLVQLTEEAAPKASVDSTPSGRRSSYLSPKPHTPIPTRLHLSTDASHDLSPKTMVKDVVDDVAVTDPLPPSAAFGRVVPPSAAYSQTFSRETPVPTPTKERSLLEPFTGLEQLMDEFVSLSGALDETLSKQAVLFAEASRAAARAVEISVKAKKPADLQGEAFTRLLMPVSSKIGEIIALREANRASSFSNHLASLAEGAPVFGWLTSDGPADYVQNFKESLQFFGNRVLKEFKSEPQHTQWANALLAYFNALKLAVDKSFKTGLTWNPSGQPLEDLLKQLPEPKQETEASPTPKAAQADTSAVVSPPPPPPPPPPPAKLYEEAGSSSAAGGMAAVFSDLSASGEAATSQLKHVDRKALAEERRKQPPRPPPQVQKPLAKVRLSANIPSAAVKLAQTKLEDNRWIIEHYVDNNEIVVEVEICQTVHIENCLRCTIRVVGKGTMVTINKCKRTGVVVDSLVSGVEIIKSEDVGLQITDFLPSLTIDQSHSIQTYLSKASLDIDIYTSQTTAINMNIPLEAEGDYKEVHLPEQILHKISGETVNSTAISSSGV